MRNVSQIFSEAIFTRNSYLQLTELDSGRSNSKMSIMNLLTYVVAVCIHTYEAILDVFEVRIATILSQRINGTPQWYVTMAKMFQYNPSTDSNDEMIFDEDTLKVNYKTIDSSHRIVKQSAWQSDRNSSAIIIKVAKENDNSIEANEETPCTNLTSAEMAAFKDYMQHIKFVGAEIHCQSLPGDIITIIADANNPIYYNDATITAQQAFDNVKKSLIQFAKNHVFNGVLYYQDIMDVIRKSDNIEDIGNRINVTVQSWDTDIDGYSDPINIDHNYKLVSGYIKFIDTDSVPTISLKNLTFKPILEE